MRRTIYVEMAEASRRGWSIMGLLASKQTNGYRLGNMPLGRRLAGCLGNLYRLTWLVSPIDSWKTFPYSYPFSLLESFGRFRNLTGRQGITQKKIQSRQGITLCPQRRRITMLDWTYYVALVIHTHLHTHKVSCHDLEKGGAT